ncbi:Uncharacterised protein [Serratia rubidaea]|uniref:Uncharacterized protein n=1 Tax=Serratia rubidaea TaxID=61652 RepID=A0A4U9HLJ6_SERRU|nr:Uncharacterised protein [Serratia rubidaea]
MLWQETQNSLSLVLWNTVAVAASSAAPSTMPSSNSHSHPHRRRFSWFVSFLLIDKPAYNDEMPDNT